MSSINKIKDGFVAAMTNSQNAVSTAVSELKTVAEKTISKRKQIENSINYFLVPDPVNKGSFIVKTDLCDVAVLEDKNIIRKRIFHVSSNEVADELRSKAIEMEKARMGSESSDSTYLNNLASFIDDSVKKEGKYLLLAGAATCVINPIAGAALMTSSMASNIGAKIITDSLNGAGDMLRDWQERRKNEAISSKVTSEYEKNQPEIQLNFILFKINMAILDKDYEPLLEINDPDYEILTTLPVIIDVFRPHLKTGMFERSCLSKHLIKYLNNLSEKFELLSEK